MFRLMKLFLLLKALVDLSVISELIFPGVPNAWTCAFLSLLSMLGWESFPGVDGLVSAGSNVTIPSIPFTCVPSRTITHVWCDISEYRFATYSSDWYLVLLRHDHMSAENQLEFLEVELFDRQSQFRITVPHKAGIDWKIRKFLSIFHTFFLIQLKFVSLEQLSNLYLQVGANMSHNLPAYILF